MDAEMVPRKLGLMKLRSGSAKRAANQERSKWLITT